MCVNNHLELFLSENVTLKPLDGRARQATMQRQPGGVPPAVREGVHTGVGGHSGMGHGDQGRVMRASTLGQPDVGSESPKPSGDLLKEHRSQCGGTCTGKYNLKIKSNYSNGL